MQIGPMPLEQLAQLEKLAGTESMDDALRARLFEQFLADYSPYQVAKESLDRAQSQLKEAQGAKQVDVMVLSERTEPRETFVLLRGVWDKHGEPVQRVVYPKSSRSKEKS